jgi:HK97 family phage portal protein
MPAVEERAIRIPIAGGGAFDLYGTVPNNPLRSVAHAAARRVMCTALASLPVQQVSESGTVRRPMTPSMVVRRPSAYVDQQAWVYQVVDSWLAAGNVYGDIVQFDSMGRPTQVEIIDPGRVSWLPADGWLTPHVDSKPRQVWPRGDLWHVAYLPQAGSPVGLSPSDVGAVSVHASIAAERFGLDFFLQGAHPTHLVKSSTTLTKDQADAIKNAIRRMIGSREPAVIGAGLEIEKMSVDPADSQFIDLMRWECEQAARIYGVPPQMIYAATSGQSVTYANASQTDLSFLKWSLRWPLRRLQFAWSEFLPTPQVVKLNVDGLLETTTMERHQLYKLRLDSKTITVNQIHTLEDELPVDDPAYDLPGIPGGAPEPADVPDVEDDGEDMNDGGAADG